MLRRHFMVAASMVLLARPLGLNAQAKPKLRRIGFLGTSQEADRSLGTTRAFIDALSELGWMEGREVAFEYRWSDQRNERLPTLAADLVRSGVDVIVVASGATGTKAAKDASNTIPIVMAVVADPVKFGLIESFAHPGGNVTGLALPLVDWGKWLELAREAIRDAKRIAVIANATNIVYADYVAQNEAAARRLDLQLQMFPVSRREDFAEAFAAMKRNRSDALVVGPDALFVSNNHYRFRFGRSTTGHRRQPPIRGARRHSVVRNGLQIHLPTRGNVRVQDPSGREASRSAGRATRAVRTCSQSKGRESARVGHPTSAVGPGGRVDSMIGIT